jgi:YHS domain-containing protein
VKKNTLLGLFGVGAFIAGAVLIQAMAHPGPKPQTTCPITGEAIDPQTSPHVDWQGQRIYFASMAAVDQFRQDPEPVFAKIAAANVRLENIETTCPVSGEPLLGESADGPVITYKGRTIRFCCKDCPGKFEVNPSRYLAAMPGEQVASR